MTRSPSEDISNKALFLQIFAVLEGLQKTEPDAERAGLLRRLRPSRNYLIHGVDLDSGAVRDTALADALEYLQRLERTSLGTPEAQRLRQRAEPGVIVEALLRSTGLGDDASEPAAIEAVLRRHEKVTDAVVVPGEDKSGRRRHVGYVVGTAEPDDLTTFLRRSLPDDMIPSAIVRLERLPLGPSGKLDRTRLPRLVSADHVLPSTDTEQALAEIWTDIRDSRHIGVNDSLSNPGDSVRGALMAAHATAMFDATTAPKDALALAAAWPPDSFLGQLTSAERDALLALGGDATSHQPGEILFLDGDDHEFVGFILAGQVKVVMADEQGKDYLLGIRQRGDLLGEMSYIDQRPHSASVVAINNVQATSVPWEELNTYLRLHPLVWKKIARLLAARLRASDQNGREIHSDSVTLRMAKLLCTLVDVFDEHDPSGTTIPLSQVEVAQLARAAEVTVNRVLREFRDQGVVRTEYRRLVVPCVVCLDQLATALAAHPKRGAKGVLGCGGSHPRRRQ